MNDSDSKLRIWIAESNPDIRQTLRIFLEKRLKLQVVGESETADGLIDRLQEVCPDLLLIAWGLPGKITSDLIRELREIRPEVKVICLSSETGLAEIALAAGADAFASKSDHPLQLKAAIDAVLM